MLEVKIVLDAVRKGEPPNRRYEICKKVRVTLTLLHPEDFKIKSARELRRRRLRRLIKEADEQGGIIPLGILAQLLCCDYSTVVRDLNSIAEAGEKVVRRRGTYIAAKSKKEREMEVFLKSLIESAEPFIQNEDLCEVLRYRINRYFRKKNRKRTRYKNSLISLAHITSEGTFYPKLQKLKRSSVKWVIKEFEKEGVYLAEGGKRSFKKCIEKACNSLGINEWTKVEILSEFESIYDSIKQPPKIAYAAAIIHEKSKVELNKISEIFGLPDNVVKHAHYMLYNKSLEKESTSSVLSKESFEEETQQKISDIIREVSMCLNTFQGEMNPELYKILENLKYELRSRRIGIKELEKVLEGLKEIYDEPILEELFDIICS